MGHLSLGLEVRQDTGIPAVGLRAKQHKPWREAHCMVWAFLFIKSHGPQLPTGPQMSRGEAHGNGWRQKPQAPACTPNHVFEDHGQHGLNPHILSSDSSEYMYYCTMTSL